MGWARKRYGPVATHRGGGNAFMGRPPPSRNSATQAQPNSAMPPAMIAAPATGAYKAGRWMNRSAERAHAASSAGSATVNAPAYATRPATPLSGASARARELPILPLRQGRSGAPPGSATWFPRDPGYAPVLFVILPAPPRA